MIVGTLLMLFAAPASGSTPFDAPSTARRFLEAFATDPQRAKQFVTKYAVIAGGDVGDSYANIVRHWQPWPFQGCRVGSLEQRAIQNVVQNDLPPRLKGGMLSVVVGKYHCTNADGSKYDLDVSVGMKNQQVAQVHFVRAK